VTIRLNNFIDNRRQATFFNYGGLLDFFSLFDYKQNWSSNYWSNWTTPDADGDGFVDNPYVILIATGVQDNLPCARENGWIATRIEQLIDQVEGLDVQQGIEKSLLARLEAGLRILDHLTEKNDVAAIKSLQAFINGVEVRRGKTIPEEDAVALIDAAQEIIDLLGSG